jgi:hypothetical protein
MVELKEHGFSEEQFDNFQRVMIHQEDHATSGDKHVAFKFHVEWLIEWITEGTVDRDNFWNLLEKMNSNKGTKNQSLESLFNSCMEQFDETFNSQTVFKMYNTEETVNDAVDGHMKNINLYLALIEFARRLHISNDQVEAKVKKLIKPFLTENLGKFNTCAFVKKLREWKKISGKKKNPNLNIHANEAKEEAFQAKLKKAMEEGKCIHCKQTPVWMTEKQMQRRQRKSGAESFAKENPKMEEKQVQTQVMLVMILTLRNIDQEQVQRHVQFADNITQSDPDYLSQPSPNVSPSRSILKRQGDENTE